VYKTSRTAILSLKAYEMVIYMFVGIVAVKIFDRFGLRVGLLLGSLLTTIGLSMQCMINESLVWAILGHLITALAWPFLWNAQSLLSSHWFSSSESERLLASGISMGSVLAGTGLSFVLCSHEFSDVVSGKHLKQNVVRE